MSPPKANSAKRTPKSGAATGGKATAGATTAGATTAGPVESSPVESTKGGPTTSPLSAVSSEQLALRPRPTPAPEALAVIAAAAQLLWTRPAAPEAPHPAHDAWRFSGRWWAQPALVRRTRPWARP